MKQPLNEVVIDDDMRESYSVFQIQCSDFIKESLPKADAVSDWTKVANNIVKALTTAKLSHKCEFTNLEFWKKHGLVHPLIELQEVVQRTSSTLPQYTWIPPTETTIVPRALSTPFANPGDSSLVDVFVQIPAELFGKRDFVNVVYAVKRAHFMNSCRVSLKKLLPKHSIELCPGPNGDQLFQNIRVTDSTGTGGVLLHFYGSQEGLAKPSRFAPNIGNLRPSTVFPKYTGAGDVPTPRFNQRLLRNLLELSLRTSLQSELKSRNAVQQALSLICSWFDNRHYEEVNHLFLSAFMVHLVKEGTVVDKQSVATIVQSFFTAFVSWDTSSAACLGLHDASSLPDDVIDLHRSAFPVVFLDSTGFLNMAAFISIDSINRAKAELSLCSKLIGQPSDFGSVFLDDISFFSSFDHYMRFSCSSAQLHSIAAQEPVDCVDRNDMINALTNRISKIIHDSMGERIDYLAFKSLNSSNSTADVVFVIGFKASKQWGNPVTVGPVANEPAAKEFRAFWHGSSQLRKFADTRICECMVWAENASVVVPLTILRFLFEKRFCLAHTCLSLRSVFPKTLGGERKTREEINSAFSSLSSLLRSLKGLPLMVTNIHGVSPYLRDTEPMSSSVSASNGGALRGDHRVPSLKRMAKFTPSVQVFIKLEYSGKWGNDYEGIRRLTAAFYIQIAEQLQKKGLSAVATMDQIFVVKDSIVFKLVIIHDKVHKMLESQVKQLVSSGATRIESTRESRRLDAYHKKYIAEVLLQSSLQSFSKKHEVFGETVQIMKRWLGAQLMSGAIPDLALEMIVAAAIECPAVSDPLTTWAAFRRCLALLSSHNWVAKPLIVDFNGVWKEEDLARLEKSFVKMRPVLPPMIIITNEDVVGSKWTWDSPSPILLKRIVALAAATLRALDSSLIGTIPIDTETLLLSVDDSAFDVVVHLHSKLVTRITESVEEEKIKGLPVVDFDPVEQLMRTLSANFSSVALFFHDKFGGERIGIKFKPSEERVQAKISRCALHMKSASESSVLSLNRDEVLEGIELLGKGIIREVVKRY